MVGTNIPKPTKEMVKPIASARGPREFALKADAITIGKTGNTHGFMSVNIPARYAKINSMNVP
jgi:hypothetical protein